MFVCRGERHPGEREGTKIPPNMALLEGRAEERGSFGELKVKAAGSGCGEHGECLGTQLAPWPLGDAGAGPGKGKSSCWWCFGAPAGVGRNPGGILISCQSK